MDKEKITNFGVAEWGECGLATHTGTGANRAYTALVPKRPMTAPRCTYDSRLTPKCSTEDVEKEVSVTLLQGASKYKD